MTGRKNGWRRRVLDLAWPMPMGCCEEKAKKLDGMQQVGRSGDEPGEMGRGLAGVLGGRDPSLPASGGPERPSPGLCLFCKTSPAIPSGHLGSWAPIMEHGTPTSQGSHPVNGTS